MDTKYLNTRTMRPQKLQSQIEKACKRIAPAWPLKNSVAVNPFLGLADLSFENAAKILSERADIKMSMPIDFYIKEIEKHNIQDVDIRAALTKNNSYNLSIEEFLKEVNFLSIANSSFEKFKVKTVVDASEELTSKTWGDFMVDKISTWAASYFDEYQASWNTTYTSKDIYESWKKDAQIDYSTELMGIKGFRSTLKAIPNNSLEASSYILDKLKVTDDILESYLHTLLLRLLGWSSYAAGKDWNNALYGGNINNLQSFLSILLSWELCLYQSFENLEIQNKWNSYKNVLRSQNENLDPNEYLEAKMILQNAYDFANQRELKEKFDSQRKHVNLSKRPKAQAVFCIDVRSEVYRRNLELVDSEIETIGFAGFFGFPLKFTPIGHSEGKNQCPVLIPSGIEVKETFKNELTKKLALNSRKLYHQFEKTWKIFKSGAISSFGFVSPIGLSYIPKLLSDSFGWTRPVHDPNKDGLGRLLKKERELDLTETPLEDKIAMASSAITAMGLKDKMALIVLITGHGSSTVNNPHATGLDCGACGGHSGEINAMTAEKILNDKEVRNGLLANGISIPEDTHFIACLHDTTTDEVKLIGASNIPESHLKSFDSIKSSLEQASTATRKERAIKLNVKSENTHKSIIKRSKDWSQIRPEWGLAGCNSFIIAPRNRTSGINLNGESFLHSYDWKTDTEFKILESIMTAPMVVTSWINLQYFASTTDNTRLGAGNKTLHNVTGGIGVLEGSAGDLRIGLPLQSIHNGKGFQHLPKRLNVVIEAPMEAINEILKKNTGIKELCDNSWISLLYINENGSIKHRYKGNLNWEEMDLALPQRLNEELLTL